MPIDKNLLRTGGANRLKANNKVEMPVAESDYAAKIADVYVFYVDAAGKMLKTNAGAVGQQVKLTLTLDDLPGIVLAEYIPIKLDPRSRYYARVTAIVGPMSEEHLAEYDPARLAATDVFATVKCEQRVPKNDDGTQGQPYPYSIVKGLRSREVRVFKPDSTPSPAPASPLSAPRSESQRAAAPASDSRTTDARSALDRARAALPKSDGGDNASDFQYAWIRRFIKTFAIPSQHANAIGKPYMGDDGHMSADDAYAYSVDLGKHVAALLANEVQHRAN